MLRSPAELRAEARIYSEAVGRETDPEMKRRLARHAFGLAQLAEQLERDGFIIAANIERYEQMLQGLPDDGHRRQVDALLKEERVKLAALTAKARHRPATAQCDHLLDAAIAVMGADMGNVQIVDPATGCLRIVASRGFDEPFLDFFAVVADGHSSVCGSALKERQRAVVPDIERSAIFAARRSGSVLRAAGVRSVQSTPILDAAGNSIGMISTHWRYVWEPMKDALKRLDRAIDGAVGDIAAA